MSPQILNVLKSRLNSDKKSGNLSRPFFIFSCLLIMSLLGACIVVSPPKADTKVPVTTEVVAPPQATPTSEAVQSTPTSPPEPSEPKSATLAFTQEFDTLNPLFAQALSSIYMHQIWNCRAWNFDEKNNVVPLLVAEIPSTANGGISADGKTITMKLRDDITWSDGTPITADDFVFTYEMIKSAGADAVQTTAYPQIESVTAADPSTVVIQFQQPYAAWLTALWHYLLPKHILEEEYRKFGTLKNAAWNRAPTVGCGPFVFDKWEAGKTVRFIANDRFWSGPPTLDEINVNFVQGNDGKLDALKSNRADLSVFLTDIDATLPKLKNAGLQILPVNSGYVEGWYFMLDPTNAHPALLDPRVRQAITLGFDRQALLNQVKSGEAVPAASLWENTPYMDPSLTPYAYDPEKAKALLDEAGWVDSNGDGIREKDGVDLVLTHVTTVNEARQAVQIAAQEQLLKLGIKLDPYQVDSDTFFYTYDSGGPIATGQYDIFQYAPRTNNYPDPGTVDFLCARIPSETNPDGENWSFLCDEELDKLLQQGAAEMDFEKRKQIFNQISKKIYDQMYFLALWSDPDYWSASSRLKNVLLSGVTPFFNAHEWDISQ